VLPGGAALNGVELDEEVFRLAAGSAACQAAVLGLLEQLGARPGGGSGVQLVLARAHEVLARREGLEPALERAVVRAFGEVVMPGLRRSAAQDVVDALAGVDVRALPSVDVVLDWEAQVAVAWLRDRLEADVRAGRLDEAGFAAELTVRAAGVDVFFAGVRDAVPGLAAGRAGSPPARRLVVRPGVVSPAGVSAGVRAAS
jgi:hypothetical protein